ncbi:hypothetical protein [Bowmanella yangjiangensis]|uniref:Uncharacterized protein n=1 Tax=Bowmanella yangjiangensis TaxID=2811230 RepID=A0ABS3CTU5_9ALTE|nr:hypothetical protein [Bowmanella yangjiangensis]MBN7820534.1 hypothetical protein [Bowmanella yangjiangensis]
MLVKISNDTPEFEQAINAIKNATQTNTASKAALHAVLSYPNMCKTEQDLRSEIAALKRANRELSDKVQQVKNALSVLASLND